MRGAPITPTRRRLVVAVAAIALGAAPSGAQTAPADSLRLAELQAAAEARDPRQRQLVLQGERTALRLRDLRAERLPALAARGQGQYQSDVTTVAARVPGFPAIAVPPNATYDAHLAAEQRLFDPSRGPRRAAEEARLAQAEAQVRVSLWGLRQQVNDAFFTAALLERRAAATAASVADLEAQLRVAESRVRNGTGLAGDAAVIEAELLRRRQDETALRADRGAALTILGELVGAPVDTASSLAIPELAPTVARVHEAGDAVGVRPEVAQFARTRDLLARQADVASASLRPRVSAYARAGYGRPGLNMLNDSWDTYWLGGVQLQWAPWDWGTARRDREAAEVQRQIVRTDEAAFTDALRRSIAANVAAIARLTDALASDARIVALRERAARETRARFREGVVTAAEYVDRETDVLAARIAEATHRVELARARADYLTTLGHEVRE